MSGADLGGICGFCGVAVCLACIGAVLKHLKPDFLPAYSACCAIFCGAYLVALAAPAARYVKGLAENTALPKFFALLLKAVGVSLLCGVAADICRACGESALASGVESAGKALIVLLSLPVVSYLLEAALQLAG